MKIEAVDFFYLSMPQVTDRGGRQPGRPRRARPAGGIVGWGECEASPLTSIAAFVCPMSHGACRPVSRLGARRDVRRPERHRAHRGDRRVRTAWTCCRPRTPGPASRWRSGTCSGKRAASRSGACSAMTEAYPKLPYASQLFGDTPQETLERRQILARQAAFAPPSSAGGRSAAAASKDDADHLDAAREGLGPDGMLLIDAGQIFGEDVEAAAARLPALERNRVIWFEEPFHGGATEGLCRARQAAARSSASPAARRRTISTWRSISSTTARSATSRSIAAASAALGRRSRSPTTRPREGVTYVNHTFTSHLALSASMQPFAGLDRSPHLRISGRAAADGLRHVRDPHRAGRATARSSCRMRRGSASMSILQR